MSVLRISFLGGLTLTWGDTPLPPPSNVTARSLLGYLIIYQDRAHTRDLLAGTFWPDLPDAVARRRLSRALWQIRRCLQQNLPRQLFLSEGDTIQLNPSLSLWLDVEEFAKCSARCATAGLAGLEQCESCVAHYQGDFMAGYYDDWILAEREHLRDALLVALERLVKSYKGRGEYERALAHARRLTAEAPWREEAHREVMRLCHLLGRNSEALHQFEACRQFLAEELDAEPSPETVALAREIAARDPAGIRVLDLPQAPPQPSVLVLDSTEATELPLVGREQERGELLAQVEALFQGLGGLVLVEGEAGVGKTRLLQTVARSSKHWSGAFLRCGPANWSNWSTLNCHPQADDSFCEEAEQWKSEQGAETRSFFKSGATRTRASQAGRAGCSTSARANRFSFAAWTSYWPLSSAGPESWQVQAGKGSSETTQRRLEGGIGYAPM